MAPLEAALCGCAVLANNIPSLREVWGEAAIYFRGHDELSRHLHVLSSNAELLATAQGRSLRQARKYTREAMTSAYLSLFESLVLNRGLTRVT